MTDEVLEFLHNQAASYRATAKAVANPDAAYVFRRLAEECDRLAAEYERTRLGVRLQTETPPDAG
jgi:non-ribosomal peptide synthetase component E (peptide arylation enzyme)